MDSGEAAAPREGGEGRGEAAAAGAAVAKGASREAEGQDGRGEAAAVEEGGVTTHHHVSGQRRNRWGNPY